MLKLATAGGSMSDLIGFDQHVQQVYCAMVEHPDWNVGDLCAGLGLTESEARVALDRLFDLDLLDESFESGDRVRVVDLQAGLRAAVARQEALAESQAGITRLLALRLDTQVEEEPHGGAERLTGLDAVQDRLATLSIETTDEVLTLMPGGAQSAPALAAARRNDEQILARGVRVCTVGLDSVRGDPGTLAYARWLMASGGRFRTVPVLPTRMVLVDRRAALVPIDPADTRAGAVYLTDPAVVFCLIALFEQIWDRAAPLDDELAAEPEGLSREERALLKLLATGLTDAAVATQLGVSPRTTRRMVADLMDRLGARSRFEAGVRCAQAGWL